MSSISTARDIPGLSMGPQAESTRSGSAESAGSGVGYSCGALERFSHISLEAGKVT